MFLKATKKEQKLSFLKIRSKGFFHDLILVTLGVKKSKFLGSLKHKETLSNNASLFIFDEPFIVRRI